MLQVEVKPTADKKVLDAPVTRVTDLSRTGTVNGPAAPAAWVVAHHGSNDMVRLRLALGGGTDVQAAARVVQGRRGDLSRRIVPGAGRAPARRSPMP